jgi:hypothetical protein
MSLWVLQFRAIRLARLGCLSICILLLGTGCPVPKSAAMAEVSGTVTFQGRPLPGGRVTFVSKSGQSFTGGGNIDENGNYTLQAPVGDVKVSVDNKMLPGAPSGHKGRPSNIAKPGLKRPGSEEAQTMKGYYVAIPNKYTSPDTSGLEYKIQKGSNTIEIKLD